MFYQGTNHSTSGLGDELQRQEKILLRPLALYSTYDGSRQDFFFYVGGNKNKNKISWLADVGGEKMKKGNLSN